MATDTNGSKNEALENMFKSGLHFGYSRSNRHPDMKGFLFGIRNNVEVFDLEKVDKKLNEAKDFIAEIGKNKKQILFVGAKLEARSAVEKAAKELEMPYITERWLGGTLTNFKAIRKRIDYMEELEQKKESGELESKYTKKERLLLEKDLLKLKRYFQGLWQMKNIPAALVIIDPCEEKIAVEEAKKISVPVTAVVNSDCNPKIADYSVPGNDNSLTSISYFLDEIVKAYKEGLSAAVQEDEIKEKSDSDKDDKKEDNTNLKND